MRLETLGFTQVFRYTPGKADWAANGLPMEGKQADVPQAFDLAKRDVPTCHLTERIGEVRERVQAAGWDTCVVVDGDRVVLGLLRKETLGANAQAMVEQVMECGPKTYRLDAELQTTADYMQKNEVDSVLVTSSDGHLVGLLKLEDVKRRLAKD